MLGEAAGYVYQPPPPKILTGEALIQRRLELSGLIVTERANRFLAMRYPTPEQIYLKNRAAFAAVEKQAIKRRKAAGFKPGNVGGRTPRGRKMRDRYHQHLHSTVAQFAEQYGLTTYRVSQIRRALRDCSDNDAFSMAIGRKSAWAVLRYPI